MSFKTPSTPKVEKTPDPLINLGETSADVQNQRNKQGFLSSFLQGTRNRSSGMLGGILNGMQKQQTLGSSGV